MPCIHEHLENPNMLVFSETSELGEEDWEGKQVENDRAGRLVDVENAGGKGAFVAVGAELRL
jgi:hypothetical protein